MSNFPG